MKKKTLHKTKAGISNIWVALLLPVLVGFMGLAIDVGYMVWVAQQLQIGADAGALAGVRHLPGGNIEATRQAAQETTGANTAVRDAIQLDLNTDNAENGDIVIGRFNREQQTFTATLTNPNAVMVVARRTDDSLNGPLPLLFGPALGFNTANLNRSAIAMFGGGTGEGLLVLNEEAPEAFKMGGNFDLIVNGGSVHVNSSDEHAARFDGSASELSTDGSFDIVGGYSGGSHFDGIINSDLGEDAVIEDPFISLRDYQEDRNNWPDWLPTRSLDDRNIEMYDNAYDLYPGYYPEGIQTSGITGLTLAPGIYVMGDDLKANAETQMVAEGVMFYFHEGTMDIQGGPEITITPLDFEEGGHIEYHIYEEEHESFGVGEPFDFGHDISIYDGISVFQSYENTDEAFISGDSDTILEGAFYFPENHLDVRGGSFVLGNQLIVNTIDIRGNGDIVINYTGVEHATGFQTFLVR